MKTADYLDQLKQHYGVESDYALSQKMDLHRQAISRYRTGVTRFDDYMCFKVAEILGLNPIEVLANINAERETARPHVREFFQKIAQKASGATLALCLCVTPFVMHSPEAQAVNNIDYAKLILQKLTAQIYK